MNKNLRLRWTWPALVVILLVAWSVLMPHSETVQFSTPLYAKQSEPESETEQPDKSASTIAGDEFGGIPWLHVTVETKYTWFSQSSFGKAWTTKTRDSEERVNVGLLCIKLDAHHSVESCLPDTSYIEVKDVRKRFHTPKAIAVVTAWAEDPDIKQTTVSLLP